ncbi:MAG: hypothetical protein OXG07_00920 [Anaerolineaceae bacterium]|nr:hypothetical protein [Anaerolineaceae bacterium]
MRGRRWRWSLATGALLLLWLMAGNSVVERLGMALLKLDAVPAELNVGGQLFYTQGFDGLWRHDLRSGLSEQWWLPAEGSLVSDVAASPDGSQLALAWAPPAEAGFQSGSTDLWLMTLPLGERRPLVTRSDILESWRDPWWSPDGDWLLVTHQRVQREQGGELQAIRLDVERLQLDGARHLLLTNAEQAALSSDGAQMVYLRPDPDNGSQGLVLARSDGGQARELVNSATFRALASPRFAPGDQAIVFSASGERQGGARLDSNSVDAVTAHGDPWNVWQVDLVTGDLSRLTASVLDGPALAWSPDGSGLLGVLAAEGLFLLTPGKMWRLAAVATEGKLTWAPAS